jgi:outer membrane receptor protein involved in Fe transport
VEVRFTSNTTIPAGDKVEWIVGAMGQRDRTYQRLDFGFRPVWWDVKINTHTEGAFAQASWMPFEKWNFTGGLRWNSDAKYYYGNYNDMDNYTSSQAEWSELTYRGNISYFFSDDIMPYLTYSKGYRTGQMDYTGSPVPEELVNAWELGIKSRFLDNKLQINAGYYLYDYKNYSNFYNVSKCWEDDNGDHECDDVGGNPEDGYGEYNPATGIRYPDGEIDNYDYEYAIQTGYSAGGADQQGFSVNIQYLPTMDDRLSLAASWRNNEYSSPYDIRAAILAMFPDADSPYRDYEEGSDLGGYEFGRQSPIRGNVSYSHIFRFDGGDTLIARGTAFYEGDGVDQVVNQTFPNEYTMPGTDAYWTGDVSLVYNSTRWMSPGNLWNLRLSVQNIFDNDALWRIQYTDDASRVTDSLPEGSGIISGVYINPRTYSLTFEINF